MRPGGQMISIGERVWEGNSKEMVGYFVMDAWSTSVWHQLIEGNPRSEGSRHVVRKGHSCK